MDDHGPFPATVMPDQDWWHALWPDPEGVLKELGIRPRMSVMDLCCGDGHFTRPLCALTVGGKVVAVDLDPDLLKETRSACSGYGHCTLMQGDARDLPDLIEEAVDHVLLANTLHGVREKTALALALYRSLKPDGRLSIINWQRKPREQTPVLGQPRGPETGLRMTPEAVTQALAPAGFLAERVVDVGPYHYAAVFQKTPA